MRSCRGGGLVTCLKFKMSRVGVYKCLSLIVGFAITVAIWPREVASCCDFILRAVATFWAVSLVRICPGRASLKQYLEEGCSGGERMRKELDLGEKKPRSKKDKRERVFWMATWWYINNLQLFKYWNLHLSMSAWGIHELLNLSSSFFTRALMNEWLIMSSYF